MSVIGPRPLLVEYLPYYTKEEHHRHDVRPGLSGWAQINGRNAIDSWEQRFQYDLEYVKNVSFAYPVSASTQLHTLQYLQNQNSSQNSIYTDSSKYNRAAARSGRAAYLLPSPYHLTTPGSTYEKLSLPEDTNQLRTLFDQMPKDEIREKVFVIVYVHSSAVGEIKGG